MLMSKYLLQKFSFLFCMSFGFITASQPQSKAENFFFWHEQGMKMYSVAKHLKRGTFGIGTFQFSGFRSANSLVFALKPSLGAANQSHHYSKPYTLKPYGPTP